ncbi:MAG TPA: hypothetical protein VKZ46_06030, partial [Pedomonas sp.]|nr:hypothetical protein [Pedomonas sp.]
QGPGFFFARFWSLWVRGCQPRTHAARYLERVTSTILSTSIAKAIISVGMPMMSVITVSYFM